MHDFAAYSKNEISLRKNSKCFVIEKNLNGWWFVDSTVGQGFVPQSVLKPLNTSNQSDNIPIKVSNRKFIKNKNFKNFCGKLLLL